MKGKKKKRGKCYTKEQIKKTTVGKHWYDEMSYISLEKSK